MGLSKFKMAIAQLIIFLFVGLATFAQKNVWKDDKEAVLKADTSLVKIGEKYYQKTITVTYKEVTESSFDVKIDELKSLKDRLQQEFQNTKDRYEKSLIELNGQLESERNFVRVTKNELKWLDKEEKEKANPKKSDEQLQVERREYFKVKPKEESNVREN